MAVTSPVLLLSSQSGGTAHGMGDGGEWSSSRMHGTVGKVTVAQQLSNCHLHALVVLTLFNEPSHEPLTVSRTTHLASNVDPSAVETAVPTEQPNITAHVAVRQATVPLASFYRPSLDVN